MATDTTDATYYNADEFVQVIEQNIAVQENWNEPPTTSDQIALHASDTEEIVRNGAFPDLDDGIWFSSDDSNSITFNGSTVVNWTGRSPNVDGDVTCTFEIVATSTQQVVSTPTINVTFDSDFNGISTPANSGGQSSRGIIDFSEHPYFGSGTGCTIIVTGVALSTANNNHILSVSSEEQNIGSTSWVQPHVSFVMQPTNRPLFTRNYNSSGALNTNILGYNQTNITFPPSKISLSMGLTYTAGTGKVKQYCNGTKAWRENTTNYFNGPLKHITLGSAIDVSAYANQFIYRNVYFINRELSEESILSLIDFFETNTPTVETFPCTKYLHPIVFVGDSCLSAFTSTQYAITTVPSYCIPRDTNQAAPSEVVTNGDQGYMAMCNGSRTYRQMDTSSDNGVVTGMNLATAIFNSQTDLSGLNINPDRTFAIFNFDVATNANLRRLTDPTVANHGTWPGVYNYNPTLSNASPRNTDTSTLDLMFAYLEQHNLIDEIGGMAIQDYTFVLSFTYQDLIYDYAGGGLTEAAYITNYYDRLKGLINKILSRNISDPAYGRFARASILIALPVVPNTSNATYYNLAQNMYTYVSARIRTLFTTNPVGFNDQYPHANVQLLYNPIWFIDPIGQTDYYVDPSTYRFKSTALISANTVANGSAKSLVDQFYKFLVRTQNQETASLGYQPLTFEEATAQSITNYFLPNMTYPRLGDTLSGGWLKIQAIPSGAGELYDVSNWNHCWGREVRFRLSTAYNATIKFTITDYLTDLQTQVNSLLYNLEPFIFGNNFLTILYASEGSNSATFRYKFDSTWLAGTLSIDYTFVLPPFVGASIFSEFPVHVLNTNIVTNQNFGVALTLNDYSGLTSATLTYNVTVPKQLFYDTKNINAYMQYAIQKSVAQQPVLPPNFTSEHGANTWKVQYDDLGYASIGSVLSPYDMGDDRPAQITFDFTAAPTFRDLNGFTDTVTVVSSTVPGGTEYTYSDLMPTQSQLWLQTDQGNTDRNALATIRWSRVIADAIAEGGGTDYTSVLNDISVSNAAIQASNAAIQASNAAIEASNEAIQISNEAIKELTIDVRTYAEAIQTSTDDIRTSNEAIQISNESIKDSNLQIDISNQSINANTTSMDSNLGVIKSSAEAIQTSNAAIQTSNAAIQTSTGAIQTSTDTIKLSLSESGTTWIQLDEISSASAGIATSLISGTTYNQLGSINTSNTAIQNSNSAIQTSTGAIQTSAESIQASTDAIESSLSASGTTWNQLNEISSASTSIKDSNSVIQATSETTANNTGDIITSLMTGGITYAQLNSIQSSSETTATNTADIQDTLVAIGGDSVTLYPGTDPILIETTFTAGSIYPNGDMSNAVALIDNTGYAPGSLIIYEPGKPIKVPCSQAIQGQFPQTLTFRLVDLERNPVNIGKENRWILHVTIEWEQEIGLDDVLPNAHETKYY
jgi:hypothetical protein